MASCIPCLAHSSVAVNSWQQLQLLPQLFVLAMLCTCRGGTMASFQQNKGRLRSEQVCSTCNKKSFSIYTFVQASSWEVLPQLCNVLCNDPIASEMSDTRLAYLETLWSKGPLANVMPVHKHVFGNANS